MSLPFFPSERGILRRARTGGATIAFLDPAAAIVHTLHTLHTLHTSSHCGPALAETGSLSFRSSKLTTQVGHIFPISTGAKPEFAASTREADRRDGRFSSFILFPKNFHSFNDGDGMLTRERANGDGSSREPTEQRFFFFFSPTGDRWMVSQERILPVQAGA